ncbi:MAG: FGGY-family carbohydrate kinase [Erysipelotrichaceae bacterium]|nr:FGGY-family carbohydrate kinase [Erysipelotrichaceae bacterium]
MEEIVLTFDIGTQSMRGMLVNKRGEIVHIEKEAYEEPYYSKNKDWAEKNPDFYYETLCRIAKKIKKQQPLLFDNILAITTTCFRDSTICLDENGKPLRDMILWLDKREIDEDEVPLPKFNKFLYTVAGVSDMVDTQHRQSVCNYIKSREPEIWQKTYKYVVLSTYMNYKLTGNLIDSGANQIAHIPFDYKKGTWAGKYNLTKPVYDVENEKLCNLCKAGENIGSITNQTSKDSGIKEGTPVIVTGSDKGCETIGLSVTSKTKAAISYGTSATIQFTTDNYFEPQAFCPSYPSPINGLYNPEYQIYRGFWMLPWFKKLYVNEQEEHEAKKLGLSVEAYFNMHLKDVPAGCDGLFIQPHWGPGVANPNAKGSMIGFSDVHSKYHIYRAVIEGIIFDLKFGLLTMSKRGKQNIKEIYVGGGGSVSDEICQITADILGLPVKRIQTNEACGLGSSIVAFLSLGIYKDLDEAIINMIRTKDIFTPDMGANAYYSKLYDEVYSKISKKLVPLYVSIKNIVKGNK